MATDLSSPPNTTAKMRWEEPYVSDGLNKKFNGIVPAGVVRGGLLGTSGLAMNVTIQADSVTGDSVYSFINSNGQHVTFRQIGDVSLDLTSVASTFVYIGLDIAYAVSSATVVRWRAFSFAEAQADSTLVILGGVDVPAVGIIPAVAINNWLRRTAWGNISQYTREAFQVVKNGAFELVGRSVTGVDDNPCPGWDYANIASAGGIADAFVNTGSPQVGDTHLQLTLSGSAGAYFGLLHKDIIQCRGGETVKVKFWIKGDSLAPGPGSGGHMGIRVESADEDPSNIIQTEYIEDLTLSGTWAYTEVEGTFKLDVDARWFGFAIFYDDDSQSSTGDVYFDDVRIWIEQPQVLDGQAESYAPLCHGDIVARGIGVSKPWSVASTIEEFVQNILSFRNDGSTDTYKMSRGDETIDFLLKLVNGGLEVENLLTLGANKVSSDLDAQEARITSEFKDGTAGTAYTLLWELQNSSGSRSNLRLYATSQSGPISGNPEAFIVTSNAVWDSVSDEWSRDEIATDSYRWDFSTVGFYQFFMDNSDPDSWVDANWTSPGVECFQFKGDEFHSGVPIECFTSMSLGLSVPDGDTILEIGGPGSVNDYQNLVKMINSELRLCGSRDVLPSFSENKSSDAFIATLNAEWNGSQWERNDSGQDSTRFDFTSAGLAGYMRSRTADSTPWNDTDWKRTVSTEAHFKIVMDGEKAAPNAALHLADGRVNLGDNFVSAITNPAWNADIEPNTLYSKNVVKAWARVSVSGPTGAGRIYQILDGMNWDSISLSSITGHVTLDFDEDMANNDYAAVVSGRTTNPASSDYRAYDQEAGYVEVACYDEAGATVDMYNSTTLFEFNIIVIGEQA